MRPPIRSRSIDTIRRPNAFIRLDVNADEIARDIQCLVERGNAVHAMLEVLKDIKACWVFHALLTERNETFNLSYTRRSVALVFED